ncbi:hypothetical protein SAMN05444487_11079 [Marininema mesophilum]|uniref:ABC-2 type transport system permease protein n=1 Tax=Marininema mesophilum TaxID=1048340 RepID=A0A1H2Z215_9BACL|nr:hypothetical protein [Marininema mesophilum]SDX11048.1 hypothetical protein SAMN05444487_11079 [Marininema mesophilum]
MKYIDLRYDWRSMGVFAYVPLGISIFVFLILLLMGSDLSRVIQFSEMSLPLFASWWSILLMQEFLEQEGNETLFSYPLSRYKMGILRVFLFWGLYILVIAWVIGAKQWVDSPAPHFFSSLFLQLGYESLFYAMVGFLLIVLTKNTVWAMGIMFVYTSTQFLTHGNLIPWLNIYQLNTELLTVNQLLKPMVKVVIAGVICGGLAQWLLGRVRTFN